MPRQMLTLLMLCVGLADLSAQSKAWFAIHVVDASTRRGVPLVTLTTVNQISHTTDSTGWIAFHEPGLMDREVFFHVSSPGYAVGRDGFGHTGIKLTPKLGEKVEVPVMRLNIAERLYRITGQGIYRDSMLLGQSVPLPRENFNQVLGQDSVQSLLWKNRVFWLWGDTERADYPLGYFHSTSAWSDLDEKGGLKAEEGIHLEYLMNDQGRLRDMMPSQEPGAVWIFGLLVVADTEGKEHLVGHYGRYKDLTTRLEHGLCQFDEAQGIFVPRVVLDDKLEWQHPQGNAFRHREGGTDWFYFCSSFAATRVPATYADVMNPDSYEALAWSVEKQDYCWQKALSPVLQTTEAALLAARQMPAERALLQVQDALTGKAVRIHRSSVAWNLHRRAWVMIGTQESGIESHLGEVWYAEAPRPSGPWRKAVKVASHPRYSFYNPRQHPYLQQQDGRMLYFEGTYTQTFSGQPLKTPRYDYNQLMYRLDVDDRRLVPAHLRLPTAEDQKTVPSQ